MSLYRPQLQEEYSLGMEGVSHMTETVFLLVLGCSVFDKSASL